MKLSFFTSLVLVTMGFVTSSCSQQTTLSTEPVVAPEPYQYFPVSFRGAAIEILAKIDTVTPITLINHLDGSVSETLTDKTGTREDEYRGKYDFTSLKASPSWDFSGNYIQKVSAVTALIGVPFSEVRVIYPIENKDQNLIKEFDRKIKTVGLLDSAIYSMGVKNQFAEEYRNSLNSKLPVLFEIEFGSKKIEVFSYELSDIAPGYGPKILAINGKLLPIKGSCTAFPHFYAIGSHLYFRHMKSLCESGFMLVENHLILDDSIKQEWSTGIYSN